MEEIYLDNSATTRVCEKSAEKVLELMTQCYGNPSSLHKKGLEAQREVAHARQAVAVSLGAQPREIIFTSGGTEANNLAVLGGAGGGVAYNAEELKAVAAGGLEASPIHQALIEKYIYGWKEIEFEVIRDRVGNAIAVCSMENFDPVRVHLSLIHI